jgi:hypothetical protein
MPRISLIAACFAFGMSGAAASESPVRQFGDWSAACDNAKECTAVNVSAAFARAQEGSEADLASPKIWVKRRAGGSEHPHVFIDLSVWGETRSVGPLVLRFLDTNDDGTGPAYRLKEIETGRYELARQDMAAFFTAARASGKVGTFLANGESHGIATTKGMRAALIFMDDAQGRAGTVTAIDTKGPAPAARVPAEPNRPTVRVVRAAGQIEGLSKPNLQMIQRFGSRCGPPGPNADAAVTMVRLADGHALHSFSCGGGGHNVLTVWAIATGKGEFLDVKLPRPDLADGGDALVLPNSRFDSASGQLTALYRARKFGDCGWQRRWAWDGRAFAMIDSVEMPACIGVQLNQWLQTYRAVPE